MATSDVIIIGGGIVGLATAMALQEKRKGSVVVLEAEKKVATHQTGHNSGVIHSGLYYKPGSLKALNCTMGRDELYRFCREYGVAHERCGKIVVATSSSEVAALEELERRGKANGLEGLRRLSREEIREHEPHVKGVDGLYVPQTGIVDFSEVAHVMAERVRQSGSEVRTGCRMHGAHRDQGEWVLSTDQGELRTRCLVNCAGLYADRVARLCGMDPGVRIIPFRGEYYVLKQEKRGLVRNLVYPVPDPRFPFLGVHFTRMVHGGVEAGPNAVLALQREGYGRTSFSLRDTCELLGYIGFWKMAAKYGVTGMGEVYRSFSRRAFVAALSRLIPEITVDDVEPGGAGVRAQAVAPNGALLDDFHIVQGAGMVHVLNAPSPAATSSITIGQTVAELVSSS